MWAGGTERAFNCLERAWQLRRGEGGKSPGVSISPALPFQSPPAPRLRLPFHPICTRNLYWSVLVFVCECICVCVCVRRGHFAQCLYFTGCLHLFCIQALVNVPVRHVSMRRNLPDVARQQKNAGRHRRFCLMALEKKTACELYEQNARLVKRSRWTHISRSRTTSLPFKRALPTIKMYYTESKGWISWNIIYSSKNV